jgi:hypothetical protein
MAKMNLNCAINLTAPRKFSYFINAADYSKVYAQSATFTGTAYGIGCNAHNALVYKASPAVPRIAARKLLALLRHKCWMLSSLPHFFSHERPAA